MYAKGSKAAPTQNMQPRLQSTWETRCIILGGIPHGKGVFEDFL